VHDESRRSGRHPATLVTQVGTFVAIGVVSTAACLVLYGGLRGVLSVIGANALALFMTAIGNTAANRRQTFRVRGRRSMLHDQVAGMGAFAIALVITTGSVAVLAVVAPRAPLQVEIAVLACANVVATTARFVVLRAAIAPRAAGEPRPVGDHVGSTST